MIKITIEGNQGEDNAILAREIAAMIDNSHLDQYRGRVKVIDGEEVFGSDDPEILIYTKYVAIDDIAELPANVKKGAKNAKKK